MYLQPPILLASESKAATPFDDGQVPSATPVRSGFTITELLVVIAILGIIIALLLPAIQAARESARRIYCINNMKNLGMATHLHINTHSYFPPASTGQNGSNSKPRHSFVTYVLPYFEEGTTFSKLNLKYHWNDTSNSDNEDFSKQNLGGILICPSAPPGREDKHVSDYAPATHIDTSSSGLRPLINSGAIESRGPTNSDLWNGILQRDTNSSPTVRVKPSHVIDGLSYTFLLFEDAGRPIAFEGRIQTGGSTGNDYRWANWQLFLVIHDYCGTEQLFNCRNSSEIYSFHPGGAVFLHGDGSVHFHVDSMGPNTFVSLFTAASGDLKPEF